MNPRSLSSLPALALVALTGCFDASSPQEKRPFALGPAIQSQCETEGVAAAFCQPLKEVIAQMLVESRDEAWADNMEQRIEEALQVDGKRWAEIRSLECRRTLCALEYAVSTGTPAGVNAEAFDKLLLSLEPISGGTGFEMPKAGDKARVVGVMVWKRTSAAN